LFGNSGNSNMIGPIGWLGLGVGVLHTLTKPNYNQLMAAIACICTIRHRVNPSWEWRGYSKTEVFTMGIKALVLLIGLFWLI
jgi:hypothetical protein